MGLDIGVAEHQLDRADVDAVGQQAAGAFVTQIVAMQIDLLELRPVDPNARRWPERLRCGLPALAGARRLYPA